MKFRISEYDFYVWKAMRKILKKKYESNISYSLLYAVCLIVFEYIHQFFMGK